MASGLILLTGVQSCSVKQCRCYNKTNGTWTGPVTTAVLDNTDCKSYNTDTRICNEYDDPIVDPGSIATDSKKK